MSWTNRHFVAYEDHTGEAHKQQAGPNGPENNADLCHIWSGDGGWTWRSGIGRVMADLSESKVQGVLSTRDEVVAAAIARNSGVMNQEGQFVSLKTRRSICRLRILT